ncbi:DUF4190 domain-containing protein [Microbacterium sp. PA5]|uniref:DUF4190 domain-containing protein n=1 Tax=Microbacterium sp. PA5 TaxID=3416654 RepID=UPI003CE9A0C8
MSDPTQSDDPTADAAPTPPPATPPAASPLPPYAAPQPPAAHPGAAAPGYQAPGYPAPAYPPPPAYGAGAQPPATGYPAGAYAPPAGYAAPYGYAGPRTNPLAITSMVSSIVGFALAWTWVLALGVIVGVITGHIALSQIARTHEKGRGMALAGVIVGWVGIGIGLLIAVVIGLFITTSPSSFALGA